MQLIAAIVRSSGRDARTPRFAILMLGAPLFVFTGCNGDPTDNAADQTSAQVSTGTRTEKNNLAALEVVDLEIVGRTTCRAFVADTARTRQLGLMNVTEHELAPNEGMIFVFYTDLPLSFWMHNTIIPLDIAYIRSDGLIVKTYTMEPLYEGGYPSIEAAKYALEVHGGQFQQWGIQEGDRVILPPELKNDS